MTADDFTPAERVVIAHACEDYAAQWYRNPMVAGSFDSTCRYVAEGHLSVLHDPHRGRYKLGQVWAAVREHLTANPEILASGAVTDVQRAANKAARDSAAQRLLDAADKPFLARLWGEAMALVDQAELESPAYTDYESYRRIIRKHEAGESDG